MSTILTPTFRVSYPNVFQTRRNDLSGKDEYSLTALFEHGEDLSALITLVQEAATKKWGANIPKGIRVPFRDQGDKAKIIDGVEVMPPGHVKGAIWLNLKASEQYKPQIIGPDKMPIGEPRDFYAGCYARASVSCYAYDQGGNRGVNFGLKNLQKVDDGDPLGGTTRAEDDFEAVAGGESEGGTDAASIFSVMG